MSSIMYNYPNNNNFQDNFVDENEYDADIEELDQDFANAADDEEQFVVDAENDLDDLEFHMMTLSEYATVVDIMKTIINIVLNMNSRQAYVFLKYIEHDYEVIADTELGDFIHDFMLTAYWSYFDHPDEDDIDLALEQLIDEQNLNSDMLLTVFEDIQKIATNVDQINQ
jgi:hypothetical protein